jgi:lipopolysaccharide heptosyltransferase I
MPDILFVKTSSLGDVIHNMPALTEARRRRPADRFFWVVEEDFAPLVRLHPAVKEVIPAASRRWRRSVFSPSTVREVASFRRGLRRRHYDEVIDTQGLIRSGLIAWFADGRRHGYDSASIRERAASWFYDLRHHVARDLHAIDRNRLLTGQALGYVPEGPADFGLERTQLAGSAGAPYAILFHATARSEKEWPEKCWIALGAALQARKLRIVLPWGSEPERRRSEALAAVVTNAEVPERQPLAQIARLVAGASLVVGVDTGLVHLAAALGVPLVAIFVGSDPTLTGPRGQGRIAVVGSLGASPSVADAVAAIAQVV